MAELALLDAATAEVAFGRCCMPMCSRPDRGHPRCRPRPHPLSIERCLGPQICSSRRHWVQFATAFVARLIPLAETASIKSSY